jgi:DNA (cytosine-5)-methyltransferase 1
MNVLDLFSGIGGFSLGLERAGMRTVAFCERDEYCRAVLRKHWPDVPCFDDIHAIDADGLARLGRIDLVCGGFPCQPFSVAGKQKGKADDRHLWPEMRRVIALARPAWVVGENVTGLIALALDDVLADLEGLGYAARTFVIPACAVDAPHRRDRVWIIARDTNNEGQPVGSVDAEVAELCRTMANTNGARPQGHRRLLERTGERSSRSSGATEPRRWLPEPDVGRVATRVSIGLDDCRGRLDDFARALARAKGVPEDDAYIGCLRALREYGEFTEAPSQLRRPGSVRDSLQIVSRQVAQRRAAGEPYEAMRDLWDEVSAAALEEAQDMLKTVLVGAWKAQCDEALGKRVHRLRCLGNAVVPQVVEEIGRAIMKVSEAT